MPVDLRPAPPTISSEPRPVPAEREDAPSSEGRWALVLATVALLLAAMTLVAVVRVDDDDLVQVGADVTAPATALGPVHVTYPASINTVPATVAPAPPSTAAAPTPTTAAVRRTGTAAQPTSEGGFVPPMTTPPPTSAVSPVGATTLIPPPTVGSRSKTTVPACRNSTDPACGPFRFDPQPAADRPMTVQVTFQPAEPEVGQEVAFQVTLIDPDGVSHGSSTYAWGDSGIGETQAADCKKFGPWDPPAPDPSKATEVLDLRHTYGAAGTYTVAFSFEAGPFACVDSVTGRGDRPYASSGSATVSVVVK